MSVCITILDVVHFGQIWYNKSLSLPGSILGPTDAKSLDKHSLTSQECAQLAFEGGKAEN